MDPAVLFDSELVRRYDRPGPRYTSYPAAPLFSTEFGEAELLEQARRSNQELIPRPLSLYVHVPFCHSPCFYCGCNRVITREPAKGSRYLERLLREVELVTPLFDPDRRVVQLHFGGGTPNFLGPAQLALLMEKLDTGFNFSAAPGRDFSIELDPRHVHAADIAAYARMGLNRASIGVQDFDPDVQRAVNRIQGVTETERRFAIGFGTYFAVTHRRHIARAFPAPYNCHVFRPVHRAGRAGRYAPGLPGYLIKHPDVDSGLPPATTWYPGPFQEPNRAGEKQ